MDLHRDRFARFYPETARVRTTLVGAALICHAGALVLASSIPVVVAAQQPPAAMHSLVFDGVTVVDVEHGKLLPHQRVVIIGNRIAAVGTASVVPLLPKAQVVDARGEYLIPGLWDLHTHSQEAAADYFYPLFLANGVTGIRDAWSAQPLETMVRWWHEILAGTRVGPPRQLLAGASFDQHYPVDDTVVVKRTVDSLKAAGANFIKLYPYSPQVASIVRRAGVQFGGHVVAEHAADASDSGMSIIDHVKSSGDLEQLCLKPGGSIERCRPLAERLQRNNTWWVPTLSWQVLFGIETEPRPGSMSADMVTRAVLFSKKFWADSLLSGHALCDSLHAALQAPTVEIVSDSLKLLHLVGQVGVPVLVGTDVEGTRERFRLLPAGFALHTELAVDVLEGLSPLQALQAATLNPAKLIHGTDSLGTVAAGKLADLVLLGGNPLADITNTTLIRAVVANGRYYDRAALDQVLAAVRAKARTP